MTNKNLKKDLLRKLSITQQGLSYRVQKLKKTYSITTEDATYIIAQKEGITLDKYLKKVEIDRVREIMRDILPSGGNINLNNKRLSTKMKLKESIHISSVGNIKTKGLFLPETKIKEAKNMAQVYPVLYVLENSIRGVVGKTMSDKYGKDWWDLKVKKPLKEKISDRMKDEKRSSWHQRRGSTPLDYTDLKDLESLVRGFKDDFVPNVISELGWFETFIDEVNRSRRVVAHMNPLSVDNIKMLEIYLKRWSKQIKDKV
jgi:ribosomal 50S subunit-recycling heat shock protein